tara:strand:+ start:10282 stop:10953 length:672 start_codon:yes stop_codon:yes gene_type:complete
MSAKYIIYKRVSTQKQGDSGLGLESQERDIRLYLDNYSDVPFEVLGEYVDILSGFINSRPQLTMAIEHAKKEKAILLVAKLDRLSRKVSFISGLLDDKKLELKVACMPNADKFQLHIYAALAEQERDFISKRTKAAMAEAKAKGRVFGGLRDKTNERNRAIQREALSRAKELSGIIIPMRKDGMSLKAIADEINNLGYKTARDGVFTAMQVKRTLDRLKTASD